MRRYFVCIGVANLVWEFAQLPLYTLWWEGTPGEIVFAAVHCTGGDILIAGATLLCVLLVVGSERWPHDGYWLVASFTVVVSLAYTIFSEWLNTEIRGSWAYDELMPALLLIGTGVSPLAQWIVIPTLAFRWARPSKDAVRNGAARNTKDRDYATSDALDRRQTTA